MGGTLTEERRSEPGSAGAGGHTDAKISNMRLEMEQLRSNFCPRPKTLSRCLGSYFVGEEGEREGGGQGFL